MLALLQVDPPDNAINLKATLSLVANAVYLFPGERLGYLQFQSPHQGLHSHNSFVHPVAHEPPLPESLEVTGQKASSGQGRAGAPA